MGTKGEIKGDMNAGTIEIRDFVCTIGEGRKGKTDAAVSVESHLMALAAEEARITGQVVNLSRFANENN